ncbi:TlpA disulfide reductase family protein [Planctobacterium marinum]
MNKNILILVAGIIAMVAGVVMFQNQKSDFKTIDGETWSWRELQGQWVVVNYFAEWCAPCLKEVPELNSFYRDSGFKLFAISYDGENDAQMQNIRKKYDMQFPIISAELQPQLPMQKPSALPATYIIDTQGKVRERLMGEQTKSSIVQAIKQLQ